jgi:hypothetical protein
MNEWLENLAQELGEEALTPQETSAILRLARDVAHGVERKLAPLSTYLVGVAVGRRLVGGASRDDAFQEAVRATLDLVPAESATSQAGDPGDG